MPALKKCLLIFIACYYYVTVSAQVVIPAFTGYALPVEEGNEDDGSVLFSEKAGLHNWTNTKQQLQYFFNVTNSGPLSIHLLVKNSSPGTRLQIRIANKKFIVNVPAGKTFKKILAGTVDIKTAGFYSINIAALNKAAKTIADIQSIELSGKTAEGVQFNAKPRRNAASVHLRYTVPDTAKVVSFYTEITVPAGADPLYTYYMACGFARGYFGIQVNSNTERRVIFSVWDAGKEAVDRNKVPEEKKVQLMGKGMRVIADGFGNEGTGGHSHLVYNWKAGETYRFLVTALPDSATATTIYAGYFFMPELQKWKLIAAFKAPEDGKYLGHLYSFLENFVGINGQLQRKAFYGNQWIRTENGQWIEITKASFSYDATGKAKDRVDAGAGAADTTFYLWNGGFQPADAKYADSFSRKAVMQNPVINFYNNADSVAQAAIDKQIIFDAIAAGKADTTGSKDGVYYKILKEGTGGNIMVSDTVVAFYKGSLLNEEVFDETKEKPATFPLNRLIKGWQTGVPLCRVGGKIRLLIPSGMAYSIRARSPKIPPNSVLVFDIEVLGAKRKLRG
jgi:FKBP-type peptidyl-prolyl cis-trans isomerase